MSNFRFRYVLIVLSCIALTLVMFQHLSSSQTEAPNSQSVEQKNEGTIQAVLQDAIELPEKGFSDAIRKDSEYERARSCLRHAREIASIPLDRFVEMVLESREELRDDCDVGDITIFESFKNYINFYCVNKLELDSRQSEHCIAQIQRYRANLIDVVTSEDDPRGLSSAILINKSLASFYDSGWGDTEEHSRLLSSLDRIADELLARAEYGDFALKLKIAGRLITEDVSGAQLILAEADRIGLYDDELQETFFFTTRETTTDNEFLQKMLTYVRAHPDDSIGFYWLAASYWKVGNRSSALVALQNALQLAPNNHRFLATLDRARLTHDTTKPIFVLKFKPPFE